MNALQDRLASAIQLREAEEYEEARQILLQWHAELPEDPQVNYQCALLDKGSIYRCIDEYQKAMETFQYSLALFPDSQEFKVFLGMAYYNIGEYSKVMELLTRFANTSRDEGILRYQRSIHFYSDKLDQTW